MATEEYRVAAGGVDVWRKTINPYRTTWASTVGCMATCEYRVAAGGVDVWHKTISCEFNGVLDTTSCRICLESLFLQNQSISIL
jgi:hypothetical protein